LKLLKSYSLKKSKSDEIIFFTFPIIDIRNRKTTPQLGEYDNFELFLRPSIIALYKKSSLYFKSVDFFHREFIYKKGASDKSSKDINVGESVLMNLAPVYF
jgi:hypothetical protein